ncbi:MAG: ABC transporter ATP-binding protein [Gammaproteobacteria bacterium]|nr:ABC transporter ATP-binding protein [Gammaproteobacteria bacterium]
MPFDVGKPLLSCSALSVSVPGRLLVEKLQLELKRGELLAVLGQNGAGKTLSLLTLAGLRAAECGRVCIGDQELQHLPRREIARRLALLPQDVEDIFPATVMDTALIGRHPHIGQLRWENAQDRAIAARALQTMGLSELAGRDVLTLSGGERRRLAIAQVLTQQPDIYLLDEPSNHLDPQHQLDAMRVFRRAADAGAAVIASLHDINLAVRFADRCLLLFGDGRWQLGPSSAILTEACLSELFATPMEAVSWRSHTLFVAGNA